MLYIHFAIKKKKEKKRALRVCVVSFREVYYKNKIYRKSKSKRNGERKKKLIDTVKKAAHPLMCQVTSLVTFLVSP